MLHAPPVPIPKLIAHRGHGPTSALTGKGGKGLGNLEPENSMEAFKKAVEMGADGIELDVYISKDGIPVVIHDDELNVNIFGVKRGKKKADLGSDYLGLASEKNADELQDATKYPLGPNKERIPTLREVLDLAAKVNAVRKEKGQDPFIVNIELKGKDSAGPTWQLVKEYLDSKKLDPACISYCSFEYDELKKIREYDLQERSKNSHFPLSKLAPSIKTALLYGQENIQMPGWIVPMNKTYQQKGLDELQRLHDELNFCAFDAVLWDLEQGLVDLAQKNGIGLHISTSDFRAVRQDVVYMQNLLKISKILPAVFFKTDEPGKVLRVMKDELENLGLDLSSVRIDSIEKVAQVPAEKIKRLPKPVQPETPPTRKPDKRFV